MEPFGCAEAALTGCRAVLRQLTAADLGRPTPCAGYTVRDVGQHLVRSMMLLASVAGAPAAGPAASPAAAPAASPGAGTLDAEVAATAEAALAAWRRRGLAGTAAVGSSVLPAGLAAEIVPLELLVHGWDIAQATGRGFDVPPAVADYVLGRARELITEDKRGRGFAAAVPAGPGATALQRLIAFTGRDPLATAG